MAHTGYERRTQVKNDGTHAMYVAWVLRNGKDAPTPLPSRPLTHITQDHPERHQRTQVNASVFLLPMLLAPHMYYSYQPHYM
jgi:hypothetical protein